MQFTQGNPCGFSTLYRCLLTTVVQEIPYQFQHTYSSCVSANLCLRVLYAVLKHVSDWNVYLLKKCANMWMCTLGKHAYLQVSIKHPDRKIDLDVTATPKITQRIMHSYSSPEPEIYQREKINVSNWALLFLKEAPSSHNLIWCEPQAKAEGPVSRISQSLLLCKKIQLTDL